MIWLLRHADAEEGTPDEERRLTPAGEQQARAVGAALSQLGVKPDVCLTSPSVRAVQSAELACEPLGVEVRLESRLAGGSFDADALAAGYDSVLLVGHEPDFSEAIAGLTGGRVDMKKGGIAGVDEGELKVLLRPKEIEAIAK